MRPSTPPCLRLRLDRRNKRPARRVRVGHGEARHGTHAVAPRPLGVLTQACHAIVRKHATAQASGGVLVLALLALAF
jgi:hypothetical protein